MGRTRLRAIERRAAVWAAGLALAIAVAAPALGAGASDDAETTDEPKTWPLERVELDANGYFETRRVRQLLSATPRPWYMPWRDRPEVGREQVDDDVDRVRAYYRSRGYYHVVVAGDLDVDPETGRATVRFDIEKGPPVRVDAVHVELAKRGGRVEELEGLREKIPLGDGDVFTEDGYERGRAALRRFYRERGFARVRVTKRATVDVRTDTAELWYRISPGPPHCTFGAVDVRGLGRVTKDVVLREVAFRADEPFDPALVDETVSRLRQLNLFESVRMVEDEDRDRRVDMTVVVREAPHREVRFGVGYDTEEGVRGLAGWRSYDFLGGARQLGFSARASLIRRTIAADFLQPHFPSHASRFRLLFLQEQQEEEGFTVLRTRLTPRLEWDVTPRLSTYLFYRVEFDVLSSVEDPVERALAPDATPDDAFLSSIGLGLDWVDVDSVVDPSEGYSLGLSVEPVGGALGGDASFLRLGAIGRGWAPLPWRVVLASRLDVGTLDPFAGTDEVPVWERAYAGGTDSVRGYARHRVGPLAENEPLGGQSWFIGSLEVRRPIWGRVSGTLFTDAGHVARDSYSLPFDDVSVGVGAGLRVATPIGPVRLDVGFPVDRRRGDDAWQLHFGVGQAF